MAVVPILSALIVLPLAGAVLLLLVRSREPDRDASIQWAALGAPLVEFALSLWMWSRFDPSRPDFQMVDRIDWIPSFGIQYAVGVDGISHSENLEVKVKKRSTELDQANASLREYSENLEIMVRQRTEELEKSKESLEALKEKVEMALYSTMDSSVIKVLLVEGRLRNEKRTVSILFSDLVNFSSYSEYTPPEVVIRDINCYLAAIEPVLLAYNGHMQTDTWEMALCANLAHRWIIQCIGS